MVPWGHPSPQLKQHLINSATTDHTTLSVTNNRPHLGGTAMWPNNNNKVTTLQALWNSPTFPWLFETLLVLLMLMLCMYYCHCYQHTRKFIVCCLLSQYALTFSVSVYWFTGNKQQNPLHTVSQKTSHLWLAITLPHTNRFWYFLAEMLLIKQAIK